MLVFIVIATVVTRVATLLLMTLLAAPLIAIVTAFLAAAIVPDRVSQELQYLDRSIGIVAGDHQLTAPGTFLGCFVPDNNAQTRTRVQRCREWVVN